MNTTPDPFDLNRFVDAQRHDYARALEEIRAGRKRSHWMWYIFPQYKGLGFSSTSQHYAIKSLEEAKAYLAHSILGRRLEEISEALLKIENRSTHEIFGSPDDLKLHSCATLFAHISPPDSIFHRLLKKYYGGVADSQTVQLLRTGL